MISIEKKWFGLFLLLFMLLSLSVLKVTVGIEIRISQVVLLMIFGVILFLDFNNHQVDFKILLFFFFGAVIMSLISLNSIYEKLGEIKFIIKYFIIFPAAFYAGSKMIQKVSIKNIILLFEILALFYSIAAFLIYFFPMPSFVYDYVNFREGAYGILYLDYQGTFFEAGWFASAVGSCYLAALMLRKDFNIWSGNRFLYTLFTFFILFSLVMSKNKTVWIAFAAIILFLIFYKMVLHILKSDSFQPDFIANQDPTLKLFLKIDSLKILFLLGLFVFIFLIINAIVPEPIISMEMLRIKMEVERGKAFLVIMDLLQESSWMGGYGFGFVESYFTHYRDTVLGLGAGSGMVFNSYLDIWLSASILGVLFHFILLYIAFDSRNFFTMVIPVFYFIFANFNPSNGGEFYYLFLGISYGLAAYRFNLKGAL